MTSATDANMPKDADKTLTEKAHDGAAAAGEKVSSAAATATEKVSAAASTASEKVTSAASATIEAAKERPYAAAGIVAGVAVAVGAAAYGVAKLRENADAPEKTGETITK